LAGSITYKVGSVTGRHKDQGIAGLVGRCHAAPGEQVPARVRARILAATRTHPQAETWLSYWSNREMMTFVTRAGCVYVSHHYVAMLWRETGLKLLRLGTFTVSKASDVR
jgi:hypothetical protein